jgi:hypothetical protein
LNIDFKTVLTLAFTTGLFTALLNQGIGLLREIFERRRTHRDAAKNFAIKLVEILTAYAQECNARANSNRYDEREGEHGRYRHLPDLPVYPVGPMELFPSKIAAGLVDLRNEITEAERDIEGTMEVVGYPEATQTTTYRCVAIGLRAYKLAASLRWHHGLGSYQGQSDFARELRSHYRATHHGPLRRLWTSLPIYRARRFISRWRRRLTPPSNR